MNNNIPFRQFLESAFDGGDYANDDVIAFVLPLFREVLSFHEEGRVAPFENESAFFVNGQQLDVDEQAAGRPRNAAGKIRALFQAHRTHLQIVGQLRMDTEVEGGTHRVEDLHLQLDPQAPVNTPVYLPGYRCFEMLLGHHDDQSDIFCLGLVLGSIALGLDLYDPEELKLFVTYRTNPAQYNSRIHPAIGRLITEMTELDRSRRNQDLYDVIQRLENYRDFDPEKQLDLSQIAGWKTKDISTKGQYILGKLRNRLFDTSRRNRLLYYKPNARFVNLTVSSVPMVLHYQSIRPEHLFTWNSEISSRVKDMKELVLNKYLRFDDHAYLASSLDKIRVEAQHDIQEYGFSQLRLVIAFLNWHNLKEDPQERIQSPLLLIPVELRKNKKLKEDHYLLKVLSNEAEVNPVVANQLRELYGIKLPDLVDLDDMTLEAFFQMLKAQIDHANQGINLEYISKPRIKLIHSVARQTVNNYRKRLRRSGKGMDSYRNLSYSYQQEHFKPLGLEIFRQRIEPRASLLEFLVNDDIKPSAHHLTGSKERQLYELAESESNPYNWDFDVCNMVLGNFNYKKMSLVRDYNQVIDGNLHHSVFEHLFSDQPRTYTDHSYDLNDPDTWHHVIAADPTQTKAVLQARTGESYIIQGPPGTGKSQTITNLIADFVAQGKSILFVCEKRAALDVVFHRLKQQGLDELCCYIHDSQSDKREFIRNLKATYEDFIKNRVDLKKIEEERAHLLQKINIQVGVLKAYHYTNVLPSDHAGMEVRKLLERIIEIRQHITALSAQEEEQMPHYREWKEFGEVVEQLSRLLEEAGSDPHFADHPFSKVKEELFLADAPVTAMNKLVSEARKGLRELENLFGAQGLARDPWEHFANLQALIEDAVLLHPLAEGGNIRLVDRKNLEAQAFERDYKTYKDLQHSLKETEEKNRGWKQKFSLQDTESALALARDNEGNFFSFFNGSWRRLKKSLHEAYNFSLHQVKPKYSQVLENLKKEYDLLASLQAAEQKLESEYRMPHPDNVKAGMERIRQRTDDKEVQFLLHHPAANDLIRLLYKYSHAFWQLEGTLLQLLHDHHTKTLTEIGDDLESLEANRDSLGHLLPSLKQYALASGGLKKVLRQFALPPIGFEATMANKTLRHIYQFNRVFEQCDGSTIEAAVAAIRQSFQQLLKINAAVIRAKVRSRFLHNLELSNRAISQLNTEQKAFKKIYAEGRKVLENEFGKSMRYKSIRELAGKESGVVLKDLKPVWLMSPLSVSDSLPVNASSFDVVIFDEASQITLEEGIPALYRAPQTIIVGDDKQMPPTNFFSARAEDPDDLEAFAAEEEDDLLSNDADSLLVQGSRKLNSVMLGWHYRSRYETLISYSNHAFYNADLLTIPDRTIHHTERAPIEVTAADQATQYADALFDRSISFHFHPQAVYEKRSNESEAVYIAHLVRELLKREVKESIGIVAFSQEQQRTIEDALTALATEDKSFEGLLQEAYDRTEDDQYVGLIVKNLENIQGDERDIIIMSVCYGPDARKRMIMNFGPINKKGGEKRLNVIFSRARKHMAVVSSIKYQQITNEYNEGASYFRRFLQYAEHVSMGNMKTARIILDSLVLEKDKVESLRSSVVLQELKRALTDQGYEVAEGVGQSGFKCSLAIKGAKDAEAYSLGILLDDDRHYSNENLLEQYYQRPAVLKAFGWRTVQVFAKDWLHQPHQVIETIRKRLVEDAKDDSGSSGFEWKTESAPAAEGSMAAGNGAGAANGMYDHLSFQRLQLVEGSSSKFWEAAVDGAKVVIRFGRIGTRGQTQVKTFATPEAAIGERARMIEEKKAKGYGEMV